MTEPEMLPAFVLHTRPYRETSQLVDLFVASMGKVSVVAKGSRTSRSAVKGLLQPFLPLHIRYSGKSNLKTLVQLEARSPQVALQGERLFSALYLNELLYHLLEPDTEYPGLYSSYFQTLLVLSDPLQPVSPLLRQFELLLLQQLGVIRLMATTPTQQNKELLQQMTRITNEDVPVDTLLVWDDLYPIIDAVYDNSIRIWSDCLMGVCWKKRSIG